MPSGAQTTTLAVPMLPRVLEPEVMDTEVEALDYDAMDFDRVNGAFCEDLLQRFPSPRVCLDVGTGTGRIPLLLCTRDPHVRVVGVDLAEQMLKKAQANIAAAGFASRVSFRVADAKRLAGTRPFDLVMSNSLIHHIPDPAEAILAMWACVAPGGGLFVRDLYRPATEKTIEEILLRYGGAPPEDVGQRTQFDRQLGLFRASLHAALTLEEARELAQRLPGALSEVAMTSDYHWTLSATKPRKS